MDIISGNSEAEFDEATLGTLKRYVYCLRDPRDRKIFYIGKAGGNVGQGNERVFDHFSEARKALINLNSAQSAKIRRIIEIWAAGEDVEWFVIRHGLGETDEAAILHVEAALIDMLEISQNGPALNVQRGHHVAAHGLLNSSDVRALAVPPVMPESLLNRPVFIFPIQNAVDQGRDAYSATRGHWSVGAPFRQMQGALAVGVVRGVSQDAFRIDSWTQSGRLWQFEGESIGNSDLHQRNYLAVISRAMGYWMRGNYLVVEFLPDQRFRFLRGSSMREPQSL
jgi:hypothetical protein